MNKNFEQRMNELADEVPKTCCIKSFLKGFQHCNDIMLEDMKKLLKTLQLYADKKNWRYCANQDIGAYDAWLDFKPDHFCKVYNELGGYNARQALQEFKEKYGEINE